MVSNCSLANTTLWFVFSLLLSLDDKFCMVYICDSTTLTMNKVDNLLKNPFKNLKHEEQLGIKTRSISAT